MPNPSNKAKGGWLQNLNLLLLALTLVTQLTVSHLLTAHTTCSANFRDEQVGNLVTILDGYFENGGQHCNLNVMDLNDVYERSCQVKMLSFVISILQTLTPPRTKTELTQRVFHEALSMDDA